MKVIISQSANVSKLGSIATKLVELSNSYPIIKSLKLTGKTRSLKSIGMGECLSSLRKTALTKAQQDQLDKLGLGLHSVSFKDSRGDSVISFSVLNQNSIFRALKKLSETSGTAKEPKANSESKDAKLDQLKSKVVEAKSAHDQAKKDLIASQKAFDAASKAVDKTEKDIVIAERNLARYTGTDKLLPVVGNKYHVKQYGDILGILVKPGAKIPKGWNDFGIMKVVSIDKGLIECLGKTRKLFKVKDLGSTLKFTKAR